MMVLSQNSQSSGACGARKKNGRLGRHWDTRQSPHHAACLTALVSERPYKRRGMRVVSETRFSFAQSGINAVVTVDFTHIYSIFFGGHDFGSTALSDRYSPKQQCAHDDITSRRPSRLAKPIPLLLPLPPNGHIFISRPSIPKKCPTLSQQSLVIPTPVVHL